MNKNYTLKELAEIYMGSPMPESACTNTVRAGIQKVLDAIGYEFPKYEEREAFERWRAGLVLHPEDASFEAWKAGREELRRSINKEYATPEKMEKDIQGLVPKEPAWIPWEGGECPVSDEVKRWEFKARDGAPFLTENKPSTYRWWHSEGNVFSFDDIVAYRVWEG